MLPAPPKPVEAVFGGGISLLTWLIRWFRSPQPPKRTSKRTPDTDKRPDYYNIQPQKADLTGALYRTKNSNISGAKVLYWLNLMQSCALLDKRLKERKGGPTLWSE